MPVQQFHFVALDPSTKPDSATRKGIRQHAIRSVAKARREGKSYGKRNLLQYPPAPVSQTQMGSGKRDDCNLGAEKIGEPTSSIARQQKIQFVQHVNSPTIVSPSCASLEYNRSLLAERIGVGRHDPFATYPIHITNKIQQVLDAVFDSRIDNLKPYRDSYYFIARNDVSAFHQFLANAALHRTLYTSGGKILTSHDATAQHHKALQLAQIRVGDIKDRVSDGMIATVLMMAAYNA